MASFCAVLFPLDVLDEIWDLIESVSEGFLNYSLLYAKYQDPSQSSSSDILFTVLFLYKMPVSEKGE